ncbi:HAD family hydrolase [Paenisporosarcina sp. OV554]|uniref:HAD family hydrolase n=1 Tax=Paenisporosarcina sp. OV554 TaxID=2135694 RepID=UPI000D36712E|nr:HAD family hydrolase [Paenisporosarcina sp. OV554]PUB12260.1 putative hydrolase of the HAD superfamily [Paenisporosarcina sp. OV554]
MIKAVIFDFDGLIIDTETVWYEAFREALYQFEVDLTIEQFALVIGTDDAVLDKYILDNIKESSTISEIKELASKLFHEKIGQPILREGVLDYLITAKEAGIKIGLASSSKRNWVEKFLMQLHILPYFEVIKTRDDVTTVKPDPELYLQAIKALGVQPEEAVAFEDSLNGLKAARAAGLKCVIFPNPVTTNLAFEDFSLRLFSMAEKPLEFILKELNK